VCALIIVVTQLVTVTVIPTKSGRYLRHELHAAKTGPKRRLWQPALGEQVQHQCAPDSGMQDHYRPQQETVWHGGAHPREQESYANVEDKKTYNIAARSCVRRRQTANAQREESNANKSRKGHADRLRLGRKQQHAENVWHGEEERTHDDFEARSRRDY
jgi:hypothetical protein